jgi:hypothetical protein
LSSARRFSFVFRPTDDGATGKSYRGVVVIPDTEILKYLLLGYVLYAFFWALGEGWAAVRGAVRMGTAA